ncbi:hypothetical protein PG993_010222 [Apiospora rasikravindrae]|uniref:Uncharacterized protein n=1 Tax=Apiospora rasikravindrae TaxID=990691 RepID=A0ABR1SLX9_9PEZI
MRQLTSNQFVFLLALDPSTLPDPISIGTRSDEKGWRITPPLSLAGGCVGRCRSNHYDLPADLHRLLILAAPLAGFRLPTKRLKRLNEYDFKLGPPVDYILLAPDREHRGASPAKLAPFKSI